MTLLKFSRRLSICRQLFKWILTKFSLYVAIKTTSEVTSFLQTNFNVYEYLLGVIIETPCSGKIFFQKIN
jgi:hypothetical protein